MVPHPDAHLGLAKTGAGVKGRFFTVDYLDFYNGRRPHSSLDGSTPDKAYFNPLQIRTAA